MADHEDQANTDTGGGQGSPQSDAHLQKILDGVTSLLESNPGLSGRIDELRGLIENETSALRNKAANEAERRKQLSEKIRGLGDLERAERAIGIIGGRDLEEVKAALDALKDIPAEQIKPGEIIPRSKAEAMRDSAISDMKTKVGDVEKKLEEMARVNRRLAFDQVIAEAVHKAGAIPGTANLLINQIADMMDLVEGQPVVFEGDQPKFVNGNHVGLAEVISDIRKKQPHMFTPTNAGGAVGSTVGDPSIRGVTLAELQKNPTLRTLVKEGKARVVAGQ